MINAVEHVSATDNRMNQIHQTTVLENILKGNLSNVFPCCLHPELPTD